jgi:DNA repair exonuclease SbcCD ATPase subunit
VDNLPSPFAGPPKPPAPPFLKPSISQGSQSPNALMSGAKPAGIKPLVLPRRVSPLQRAQEASQATAEARRSIDAIMSQSRSPWIGGKPAALSGSQVESLEKALRALEVKVVEREMALAEAENKLAERDRALAETEALLQAREKVIDAMRKQSSMSAGSAVNPAELEALGKLKEELDRQEASMKEQRDAIKEREEFLEQSETALFEKMQAQQGRAKRANGKSLREPIAVCPFQACIPPLWTFPS